MVLSCLTGELAEQTIGAMSMRRLRAEASAGLWDNDNARLRDELYLQSLSKHKVLLPLPQASYPLHSLQRILAILMLLLFQALPVS